jgi:undecaprenyl-phosphate 4-deoxy-4-formamido-L-arabinose transferase
MSEAEGRPGDPAAAPEVSVVIPVYRAEHTIVPLVERLVDVLAGAVPTHEVVLVNDASPDRSWDLVRELAGRFDTVRGLDLSRNFGQHSALLAGIRSARGDVIVTMDDDLQHRPEDVPLLLAALDTGVDLVYGVSVREEHGLFRNLASRLVKASLASAIGSQTARIAGAFRAFRTSLRDAFAATDDPYASIDVLLSWATTRVATADVTMDQRQQGRSNYTFASLARHAVDMATGYGTAPLRFVTKLGFGFALVGLAIFVYVIVRFFVDGSTVPGFPFLASLVAILSGVQLFALGMIGEYLGRIHFRSMRRPPYVIRQEFPPRADAPDTP